MSKLSWGLGDLEFVKLVAGAIPTNAVWKKVPEVKQGTLQLTNEAGERVEAIDERGDVVDTRTAKSKYKLEFQVYLKKGDERIIDDNDGVIVDNYAIRLTPEDKANAGFQMNCCSVAVEETWTVADGTLLKYTFSGLKPADGGKICRPYTKTAESGASLEE